MVTALVPEAGLARYAVERRSPTGGRGRFVAEHLGYDVVPSHLVDAIRRHVHEAD